MRLTAIDHWNRAEAFGEDFNGSPCMYLPNKPTEKGYVRLTISGRQVLAHRAIYEALFGAIADGLEPDHLCRNRACVNAWHMETVTHRVNTLRGRSPQAMNSLKERCPSGHPLSGENLYVWTNGKRSYRTCRICSAEHKAAYRRRRRAKEEIARLRSATAEAKEAK